MWCQWLPRPSWYLLQSVWISSFATSPRQWAMRSSRSPTRPPKFGLMRVHSWTAQCEPSGIVQATVRYCSAGPVYLRQALRKVFQSATFEPQPPE